MIAETQHTKSALRQKCIATYIPLAIFGMKVLPPINFNHELGCVTHEIDNEWSNRGLAPKASAIHAVCAQRSPDDLFCIGGVSSQLTCSFVQVVVAMPF